MPSAKAKQSYRVRKIAEGVCWVCGHRPPESPHTKCRPCLDRHTEQSKARQRRLAAEKKCHKCGKPMDREGRTCTPCASRFADKKLEWKLEVFEAYGGAKCACCGETILEFLTIDHIDGGGTKHRKATNRQSIYQILRREGFPPGYQVLCWNCNAAKGLYGECPHQTAKCDS